MILSYILLMNTINPIVILDIFDIHPTFEQFKTKINEKSEDGQRIYNLEIKETDKLVIVYCDNFNPSNDVELWTKSIIFEKQTMKPIGFFNFEIIYALSIFRFFVNFCFKLFKCWMYIKN